jgi:hypothetical protein
MNVNTRRMTRGVGFGLLLLLSGVSFGALAQGLTSGSSAVRQVAPAQAPRPAAAPANQDSAANASSTITELQGLIQDRGLNELRTTYNGNYGTSLLFKADDLVYYVALFQQKNFWRVVKTTSEPQAEQLYKTFVDQTAQLADVDIRRIKLDAERTLTDKLISVNEGRLNALQNDLIVQRQQEQQVAARQEQARQEAAALANDRQSSREQLNALQRQIQMLEAQQSRMDVAGTVSEPEPARRKR